MAWVTPKRNWTATEKPDATDFNRIEGNAVEVDAGIVAHDVNLQAEITLYSEETDGSRAREILLPVVNRSSIPATPNSNWLYTLPAPSAAYNGNLIYLQYGARGTWWEMWFCRRHGASSYQWVLVFQN